jgi:hypothetical protein
MADVGPLQFSRFLDDLPCSRASGAKVANRWRFPGLFSGGEFNRAERNIPTQGSSEFPLCRWTCAGDPDGL